VALGLGMLALPALSCVGGLMLATLSPPIAYRYTPPPLPRSATAVAAPTPAPSVARDLACALDPARLSRRVGIEPDDWQAELLRSDDRQVLVNCSRQVGKSQTTATLAAHTALYCPGEPVLLLSPTLRQSSQLFQKVKWALKRVGATSADATTDNALSVKLANGSEIHSLPGKGGTIRGFSSVRLIVVDEAAFVADDLYSAISPMLAVSGGRLILLSTPFGKRGFFHEEWANGGDDWRRFAVTAEECPRIPPEFLERERRMLGALYAQEYGCQFLDIVRAVFRHEDVARAITDEVRPLFADDDSEVA
jgi:hypothetical protein